MKVKEVKDVRALLRGEEFIDWSRRYAECRSELESLRSMDEDVIVHTILLAGELDDLASQAETEFKELEESFEQLSEFAIQRKLTTESWIEFSRTSSELEDVRQQASELNAQLEACKIGQATGDVDQMSGELESLELRVESTSKQAGKLHEQLKKNEEFTGEMWTKVEKQWEQTFRTNMATKEYAYQARKAHNRARKLAEAQEAGNEERPEPPADLDEKLDELMAQLGIFIAEAEHNFDCMMIESFLYWPLADEISAAIVVPLQDELDEFNLQVRKHELYQIEREKGLEFIEPFPEEPATDDDPRLETFFVDGRKTEPVSAN